MDTGALQVRNKNALLQPFHNKVHLQRGTVHVEQRICEEGFDSTGLPALTKDTDSLHHQSPPKDVLRPEQRKKKDLKPIFR